MKVQIDPHILVMLFKQDKEIHFRVSDGIPDPDSLQGVQLTQDGIVELLFEGDGLVKRITLTDMRA